MLEAVYLAFILGCSDDVTRCEIIDSVDGGWTQASACEAEIPSILRQMTGADFPMVAARCGPTSDPLVAILDVQHAPTPRTLGETSVAAGDAKLSAALNSLSPDTSNPLQDARDAPSLGHEPG